MSDKPFNDMNEQELDAAIDEMLERARNAPPLPEIVFARYHAGMECLEMKLNDGRRLLVPKEELGELKRATPEQAKDLFIGPHGLDVWWPQLDDGLYLPDFLEHRWRKEPQNVAA